MTDWIQAWQCIGCGKIEAPQPCIGVCRDRKILMVGKDEHEQALHRLHQLEGEIDAMRGLLVQLAWSSPNADAWERSYCVLQLKAKALLAGTTIGSDQRFGSDVPDDG